MRHRSVPAFRVTGKFDSLNACITKPFTGEISVEQSSSPIRSIDLQLVRVESCGYSEGMAKEGKYMIYAHNLTQSSDGNTNFTIDRWANL